MNDPDFGNLETDPRFPSGGWKGFFLQYWIPGRHATQLTMSCQEGELSGNGQDWVGRYTIDGSYDVATGQCKWTKKYLGKHSVAYRGVNDGKGIWGVWEIRQLFGLYTDRGGFHIWPEGTDVSEESDRTEEAVKAAMRQEFGGRLAPGIPVMIVFAIIAGVLATFLKWYFGY